MVFPDFPPEMITTRVELATNYLNVLNIIEPGLSKFRAKLMFELIDTKMYLFSRRFQETGEANLKELQGEHPGYFSLNYIEYNFISRICQLFG